MIYIQSRRTAEWNTLNVLANGIIRGAKRVANLSRTIDFLSPIAHCPIMTKDSALLCLIGRSNASDMARLLLP